MHSIPARPYERVFKMDGEDRSKDVVFQMESCPFPIIGAINGWAINAGFEISLACDMLLASPGAKFLVGLGESCSPHDVNHVAVNPRILSCVPPCDVESITGYVD